MSLQTTFGDEHCASRSMLDQRPRHIERYVEGVQVAIVYADQSSADIFRNFHFFAGVNLDQYIHTQFVLREAMKVSEGIGAQRRDNKKYRVRAGCRGFENLKLIKDKIL